MFLTKLLFMSENDDFEIPISFYCKNMYDKIAIVL